MENFCRSTPVIMFATLVFFSATSTQANAQPSMKGTPHYRFDILFHVPTHKGEVIVANEWLKAQLDRANEIFEVRSNVRFRMITPQKTSAKHRVDRRRDRHRLAAFCEQKVINVFVVSHLKNLEKAPPIRGVHWRSRSEGDYRHYIILSTIASPSVLAHELGHFFGNPHSDTHGNIMSYKKGKFLPFFDRRQIGRIRRWSKRFAKGELRYEILKP